MCGYWIDFYLGITMNEREAYMAGNIVLADALGRIEDLQQALGESVAREQELEADAFGRIDDLTDELGQIRMREQELEADVEHLKRILRDALADDCWRERAEAQLC